MENVFVKLASIDVSKHIEKKGKFSYLSWPFAISELRKADPNATWEVLRFDGMPYMKTELGYFVEVAVTVNGITLSQIHPVLDNNNRPIAQPTTFQINTSIQRGLVKAIALHGLGLSIYAGEDLPLTDDEPSEDEKAFNKEAADRQTNIQAQIKAKWQTLNGSLDGLEAWMNEARDAKGWNLATMNEALARSLAKLAEEKNAPTISDKQVKLFNVKAGKEAANILKRYGFEKPEQITKDKFNEILKAIPEVITKDEDLPF